MKINRGSLRELVREIMSEMDESDLLVKKDGRTWEEMSSELKSDVDKLINNITNDKYIQALDDISGISAVMKIWKHRIVMGGARKKPEGEEYNMKKFNLEEEETMQSESPTREELAKTLSTLLGILDDERAYKPKDYKPEILDGAMQTYTDMQHARELLKKMGMTATVVRR